MPEFHIEVPQADLDGLRIHAVHLAARTRRHRRGADARLARLYLESIDDVSGYFTAAVPDPIDVPVVGVMFPAEVPWVSRRWAARRFPRIVDRVEPARGGHFPGLENPDAVADAVRRVARG